MDFVLDFETMGTASDCVVLSLAVLPFNRYTLKSFNEYVDACWYWKFDIEHQLELGRTTSQATLDWWDKQDAEVKRSQFEPTNQDVRLEDMIVDLSSRLKHVGVDNKSIGWARGKEFDFGIMTNIVGMIKHQIPKDRVPLNETYFPVPFWQRRDIRDYIAGCVVDPMMTRVPLPLGSLEGFEHHNPIHDCARAVMHIKYAEMYAKGELELSDEVDPFSNK